MWDKQSSLSITRYGQSLSNVAKGCTLILLKQRAGLVYTRKCPTITVATELCKLLVNRSEKNAPFAFSYASANHLPVETPGEFD